MTLRSEQKLLSKATNFLCDVWARNGKNKGLTSQNIAKEQHGYGGDSILKSTAVCPLDFYYRSRKTTLHSAQRCSKHICEVSSPLPRLQNQMWRSQIARQLKFCMKECHRCIKTNMASDKHGFFSATSLRDIRKTIGVPWNDWSDDAAGQPLFQSFSHICDMSWLKSLTHVKSIWYHLQNIHPFKGCVMHWLRRQCPLVKQATPLALGPLLQIFAATRLRVPRGVCKNRSTPETKHTKTPKSLCVYENLG